MGVGGDQVLELQVDGVGPAEAYDVGFVTGGDLNVGGAVDYVIFFAHGSVEYEVVHDGLREFEGDAGRVGMEPVAIEPGDVEPGGGGPSEGQVPLDAGVEVAHG